MGIGLGAAFVLIASSCIGHGLAARPVVISTDCGASHDDQWAIVHLALSPELNVRGIVSSHAANLPKPAADSSATAARDLIGRLHLKDPPRVLAGASEPLGKADEPRRNQGVDFLLEQAKDRSATGRLVVVMIGPATDVASALLIDPTWADRVEIVSMAFDKWPEGGDPWNVKNDVNAWRIVLASRVPLVVGDDFVCRRDLSLSVEEARERLHHRGDVGAFLSESFADAIKKHPAPGNANAAEPRRLPVWDEVVVAYLLGVTRSEQRPRPSLRDDRSLDHSTANGTITWVVRVDSGRLWKDLASKLNP
jgi:purine nucleosidase